MDGLNWLASTWFFTPVSSYADFTALNGLPAQPVRSEVSFKEDGGEGVAVVTLTNPGPALAFMVRMKLNRAQGGEEILPVFWADNYVSLLPGESREIEARWLQADFGGTPALEVTGWNVK
jgi:exo-1,4-beta-D-glucosaminidase